MFYADDVYKRKQAQHFVLKKHQLEDYLKTISPETLSSPKIWFVNFFIRLTNEYLFFLFCLRTMQPMRRLFYLSLVNSIAFIIGSQTAHVWLNPMKDYKDFILKAEADYQAHQEELRDVEDYLEKKRQQRSKQIS